MIQLVPYQSPAQVPALAAPDQRQGALVAFVQRADLVPTVRDAALAYLADQPPVGQVQPELLAVDLIDVLSGALFILGHTNAYADREGEPAGQQIELLAREVGNMIRRRFAALKPAEVREAVRRGAAGDWHTPGQVLALNVPTVAGWLNAYQRAARVPAMQALKAAVEDVPEDLTPCQLPPYHPVIYYLNLGEVLDGIDRCQQAGQYVEFDPRYVLYDWLRLIGVFDRFYTRGQQKGLLMEEAERLRSQPRSRQTYEERGAFRTFDQLLVLAVQGDQVVFEMPKGSPLTDRAKAAARRRLMREWVQAQTPESAYQVVRECFLAYRKTLQTDVPS